MQLQFPSQIAVATMPPTQQEEEEVIQQIKSHLTGKSTVSAIVSALAEPIEAVYTTGEVQTPSPGDSQTTESGLWTLWYSIIDLAKQTPHSDGSAQTALVELVAALKARPNPPAPKGHNDLKSTWGWSDSGGIWTDLIIFGPSMRESWNDPSTGPSHPDYMTVEQWTNLNAFVARITAAGVSDYTLYAIWSLRDTVETEVTAAKLDALLPASAMWIEYSGRKLYESDEEWPVSPTQGNPAGGGPLWTGKSGVCKERWRLWKRMFEKAERRSDIKEETRKLAGEAVTAMKGIEQGREVIPENTKSSAWKLLEWS